MKKQARTYVAMSLMFGIAIMVILGQRATDADRVNAVAHEIADFALPAGYQTDYVLEIGGYTFAAYKSEDGQSHLAFVQVPEGIIPDDEVIEGHVFGGTSRESQRQATVLSTAQYMVRGQPATLTVSERVNGDGQLYRSAYLVFDGRDGTAVLVMNQPARQWDNAEVDAVIESIQ